MRSAILIVALAFGIDFGVDAAATAARQEKYYAHEYADAREEMEHEMNGIEVEFHDNIAIDDATGQPLEGANHNRRKRGRGVPEGLEDAAYRKKVDKRKAERERRALDEIERLNDPEEGEGGGERDRRREYHQRQEERRARLDEMHTKVSEALDDHHAGRKLLDVQELEVTERRKGSLERKRRSLEEESPERYMERMERREERAIEKLERKKRRHDERTRSRTEEL